MEATIEALLEGLSAPRPTPAGGAAAALALAEAAALGLKVVRISARREPRASLEAPERELARLLEAARPLFEADCRAVEARRESVEPLIRVPLAVLGLARAALECLDAAKDDVLRSVASDALAAGSLAHAAAEISFWNVRNNVSWGTEPDRWREELEAAERQRAAAARAFEALAEQVARRLR